MKQIYEQRICMKGITALISALLVVPAYYYLNIIQTL